MFKASVPPVRGGTDGFLASANSLWKGEGLPGSEVVRAVLSLCVLPLTVLATSAI